MTYLRQVLPISRRIAERLEVLLRVAVVDDQRVPHLIVTFFVVTILLPFIRLVRDDLPLQKVDALPLQFHFEGGSVP